MIDKIDYQPGMYVTISCFMGGVNREWLGYIHSKDYSSKAHTSKDILGGNISGGFLHIKMISKELFDHNIAKYVGDYIYVCIDDMHRFLKPYYLQENDWVESRVSKIQFQLRDIKYSISEGQPMMRLWQRFRGGEEETDELDFFPYDYKLIEYETVDPSIRAKVLKTEAGGKMHS